MEISRKAQVEARHGALGMLLLPMMMQDPYNGYSNALHKKVAADHGENFASKNDVTRALKLLVDAGMATATKEEPDRHESKVFYYPTFLGGMHIANRHPVSQWAELDLLLERQPPKSKAA